MKTPYIIAEIGSNCFKYETEEKNLDCAFSQIEMAKMCNANAAKFQFFTAGELYGKGISQQLEQQQNRWSMPQIWLPKLAKHCAKHGIDFMCSAFSPEGFKALEPYVKAHKVASPEMNALDIAVALNKTKRRRMFSLGCMPDNVLFQGEYDLRSTDTLLECVSDYPADPCHYDLVKVKKMAIQYGTRWGISDHTKCNWMAVFARSLGATVFEKHVDFLKGTGVQTPDTVVSIGTSEFRNYTGLINRQEIIDHKKLKIKSKRTLARRKIRGGWYRDIPGG